jgi:hypothetical protein
MEIKDFYEINALHSLLLKIKMSDSLDSEDIDYYADSGIISNILERLNKEFLVEFKKQVPEEHYLKYINFFEFKFDSEFGKTLQQRIQNWNNSIIENLKSHPREQFIEIAKNYIVPFEAEESELKKLVNFIEDRVKEK